MNHKIAIAALLTLATSSAARADSITATDANSAVVTNYVVPGQVKRLADRPQGWSYNLTLAANLNVTSNQDVVGQLQGNSVLMGGSVLTGIGYVKDKHEWLNTGSLTEAWSKTPALPLWVKSNDVLDLQSLYNFFLNEWTGPFARVAAQTGLFRTERVTPQVVDYREEGVPDADPPSRRSSRLRVSDSYQPFTLNESAGWFAQPLRSEPINVYARAGLGGRHTFAEGALAVTGDLTAPSARYKVLKDVHQAGVELFAGADGKQLEGKLVYSAGLTALFPVFNNDDTDRSILKLTRVSLAGAVGMGVFSWMSINYQLKVIRDVQLIDAVQVQNALLLSFQYALSSPKPKVAEKPLPPEAQARIKALEQRATQAEERAAAAEARSKTLPAAAPATPVEPAPATPVEPAPVAPAPPAEPAPVPATP